MLKKEKAEKTCKENGEDNDELVDCMSNDVLHHGSWDEWFGASVWLTFQHLLGRQFRRQRQWCQRVHDEVHPQHLNGFQWRVLRAHVISRQFATVEKRRLKITITITINFYTREFFNVIPYKEVLNNNNVHNIVLKSKTEPEMCWKI